MTYYNDDDDNNIIILLLYIKGTEGATDRPRAAVAAGSFHWSRTIYYSSLIIAATLLSYFRFHPFYVYNMRYYTLTSRIIRTLYHRYIRLYIYIIHYAGYFQSYRVPLTSRKSFCTTTPSVIYIYDDARAEA